MRRKLTSQRLFTSDQLDPRFKPGNIGHWIGGGLGSILLDRSGYGNHAAFVGAPRWVLGVNNLRDAVQTAAGSDRLQCGLAPIATDLTALSVSAWVYPSAIGAEQQILTKLKSDNTAGWVFVIENSGILTWFAYTTGVNAIFQTTPGLTANRWWHVGYTQAAMIGVAGIFYIQGVPVTQSLTTNGSSSYITDAAANLCIAGREFDTAGLTGMVDDVRLFNRVLSPAEMSELANPAFLPVVR